MRYAQQIDDMNLHIRACCRVIQRLAPGLCGKSDPQTLDQETTFTRTSDPCRKQVSVQCDMTTPTYSGPHVPNGTVHAAWFGVMWSEKKH